MFRCWIVFLSIFLMTESFLQAQVLYLIAGGDIHSEETAETVRRGTAFWTSLFVENLPAEKLSVYNGPDSVWTGAELFESGDPYETLKSAVAACPAGGEDGILVFWLGKGGFQHNHFFFTVTLPKREGERETFEEKQVLRSDLTLSLKEKKVRFAGLVSDSSLVFKEAVSGRVYSYKPDITENLSLMTSLFFDSHGFLDLNSCRKGTSSLILPDYGTLMTEAFGEFLETSSMKSARWTEAVESIDMLMAKEAKGHKQRLEVFSIPKEPAGEADDGEGSELPNEKSAAEWQKDWNEIAQVIRHEMVTASLELYPLDYSAGSFRSALWSPPLYYPEPGDILIGINGNRIDTYPQFLDEIEHTPSQIYLTIIDHRTGRIFLMRTVLGIGTPVRLGLGVEEEKWGGVRVTEIVPGSPASRCQYLIGFRPRYYRAF